MISNSIYFHIPVLLNSAVMRFTKQYLLVNNSKANPSRCEGGPGHKGDELPSQSRPLQYPVYPGNPERDPTQVCRVGSPVTDWLGGWRWGYYLAVTLGCLRCTLYSALLQIQPHSCSILHHIMQFVLIKTRLLICLAVLIRSSLGQ